MRAIPASHVSDIDVYKIDRIHSDRMLNNIVFMMEYLPTLLYAKV